MPMVWGDPGDKFAAAGIDAPADEWGEYALYRDDVVENAAGDCQRLEGRWRTTRRGRGVVGISFGTDCYMDPRAGELTRGVVAALVGHGRRVRVLTRNPKLLVDLHGEFYAGLPTEQVTVGTSIPSLEAAEVAAIEGRAPPVEHRFSGMERLRDLGVRRFVSMSPTYPTSDYARIRRLVATIRQRIAPEVVFCEPINSRSRNFEKCVRAAREAGEGRLAAALDRVRDADRWGRYAIEQLRAAQLAATVERQPVHLWPDSRLVEGAPTAEQREWCAAWRERASPERFGDGGACDESYPPVPALEGDRQGDLAAFAEPGFVAASELGGGR